MEELVLTVIFGGIMIGVGIIQACAAKGGASHAEIHGSKVFPNTRKQQQSEQRYQILNRPLQPNDLVVNIRGGGSVSRLVWVQGRTARICPQTAGSTHRRDVLVANLRPVRLV